MTEDQRLKMGTKPGAAPASTERAGAAEVSPSERQQPPGEQQGESALRQHAAQQQRAQQTPQSPGGVQQNVGPGESQPPLAPRNANQANQQSAGSRGTGTAQPTGPGASAQERQRETGKTEFEDFLRVKEDTPYSPQHEQEQPKRKSGDEDEDIVGQQPS